MAENPIGMHISLEEWEKIIRKGIAPFNLSLTKNQVWLFYQHASMLLQWTQKINITAITDPREIAIKHFIDSLAPALLLTPMKRVLDIGSGGGFPGLPLKVLYPAIELTLLDAVRKKTSFMQHVIRTLKLKGVRAIHGRVEDLFRPVAIMTYDTIICRAFSDLSFIITHAFPLLSKGGKIVVWKGRVPEKEITAARSRLHKETWPLKIELRSFRLPVIDAERTIVIISKDTESSDRHQVMLDGI